MIRRERARYIFIDGKREIRSRPGPQDVPREVWEKVYDDLDMFLPWFAGSQPRRYAIISAFLHMEGF